MKLAAPDLSLISAVNQFGPDDHTIIELQDSSRHDQAHAEMPRYGGEPQLRFLVTEDGVTSDYPQAVQLGEVVDNAFRNPIRQVFGIGIVTAILKWQHRKRIQNFERLDLIRR